MWGGRNKYLSNKYCHLGAFMCHLILLFITTVISSLFLCCFPDEKMGEQKVKELVQCCKDTKK